METRQGSAAVHRRPAAAELAAEMFEANAGKMASCMTEKSNCPGVHWQPGHQPESEVIPALESQRGEIIHEPNSNHDGDNHYSMDSSRKRLQAKLNAIQEARSLWQDQTHTSTARNESSNYESSVLKCNKLEAEAESVAELDDAGNGHPPESATSAADASHESRASPRARPRDKTKMEMLQEPIVPPQNAGSTITLQPDDSSSDMTKMEINAGCWEQELLAKPCWPEFEGLLAPPNSPTDPKPALKNFGESLVETLYIADCWENRVRFEAVKPFLPTIAEEDLDLEENAISAAAAATGPATALNFIQRILSAVVAWFRGLAAAAGAGDKENEKIAIAPESEEHKANYIAFKMPGEDNQSSSQTDYRDSNYYLISDYSF